MRDKVFAALAVLIGIALSLIIGELACRILPVNDGLMAVPVNGANPVFHFAPNREITWSRGWNFSIVNKIRVNNAGYVNDQDYAEDDQDDQRPLLAVVGDSYVEAAMVPYRETLQGRLAAAVAPRGRVYSFAASGAPLSQYLVWAHEARERWHAQALIIVVVGNDFDESLAVYSNSAGFHHYGNGTNGTLHLQLVDYQPSNLRIVARRSALIRYLLLNLQAQARLPALFNTIMNVFEPAHAQTYVGNTAANADADRIRLSEAAVRAFFRDLKEYAGWRPGHVLFVLDGIRYPNDSPAVKTSYFMRMRTFFMEEARRLGYEGIDLDTVFFAHFRTYGKRFEFPTDGHWNGLAHGLAADAVRRSELFSDWEGNKKQVVHPNAQLPGRDQ